eukprot:564291-Rhodomonas_salina.3
MSGTEIAYGATELAYGCTEIAYGATRSEPSDCDCTSCESATGLRLAVLTYCMALRIRAAVCSTEKGCGPSIWSYEHATHHRVLRRGMVVPGRPYQLQMMMVKGSSVREVSSYGPPMQRPVLTYRRMVSAHAISVTDIAYDALSPSRCPVLSCSLCRYLPTPILRDVRYLHSL